MHNKKLKLIELSDFIDYKTPWIAVRKDGLSFNSSASLKLNAYNFRFCQFHQLEDEKNDYLTRIYLDPNNLNKSRANFRFTVDSRRNENRKMGSRYLPCRNFIRRFPQLVRISGFESGFEKRLELKYDDSFQKYFIELLPNFQKTIKVDDELPSISCMYSLYQKTHHGGGSFLVYLGETSDLKRRTREHLKTDQWDFFEIQYSPLNERERVWWENFYLEKYKNENNGRLPLYNKISGKKIKEDSSEKTIKEVA